MRYKWYVWIAFWDSTDIKLKYQMLYTLIYHYKCDQSLHILLSTMSLICFSFTIINLVYQLFNWYIKYKIYIVSTKFLKKFDFWSWTCIDIVFIYVDLMRCGLISSIWSSDSLSIERLRLTWENGAHDVLGVGWTRTLDLRKQSGVLEESLYFQIIFEGGTLDLRKQSGVL